MITICADSEASKFIDASDAAKNWLAEQWLAKYRGQRPTFACILSFTETGLIPQISAAGKTVTDRRYTAAADGEFLLSATPQRYRTLPPLAAGVSPAVISRAVLRSSFGRALPSLNIPIHLLSTGLPTALRVPHIALPTVQARSVETGHAMSVPQAEALFSAGLNWGTRLASANSYLILGECVVGGTTTAQAVLTALGYEAAGRMSSSHLVGNHSQKQALVSAGIAAWRRRTGQRGTGCRTARKGGGFLSPVGGASALSTAAAVGDPMQLVSAGMMLAASLSSGVLLAGGAQMLAVYALARAIARQKAIPWQPEQVVVGTTRWVIEDSHADTVQIARQVGAPYLASQIHFGQSPYMQLRAYEQGFVKEGMGAGGCAIAAHLYRGWNRSQLRHAVEAELRQAF